MRLEDLGWDRSRARQLPDGTRAGRIVAIHRGFVDVVTDRGREQCRTRRLPVRPATGDWVALDRAGAVSAVLPREGALEREDGAIVANVDAVLVAVPADVPDDLQRVQRIAALWADPVLVVTKADAGDGPAVLAAAQELLGGAPGLVTSARTGEGLDALRALVPRGTTAVLVGRSGAGKSSLVNALLGQDAQAVGAVRDRDQEGRHTTTRRELLLLPGGGALVDTPGIKLPRMAASAGVEEAFPDVLELARQCRFTDCTHTVEPGCAVREAVEPERLERFRALEAERDAARGRRR